MGPSLRHLADQALPLKISYRLSKFIKKVTEELTSIEQQRIKLVNQFGDEDKEKGMTTVSPEKEPEFQKMFTDFLNENIDIDIDPIKISDIENVKLSVVDIFNLDKIFVS
jgi:hypothetical protein